MLMLDGNRFAPPDNVNQLMDSILQDSERSPTTISLRQAMADTGKTSETGMNPADVWKGLPRARRILL